MAQVSVSLHISGKSFVSGEQILAPLQLSVASGEFLCVLGPSGCGKSTLLNILAGITQPDDFISHDIPSQHRIGYVFQEPRLMPWLTAIGNILLVQNTSPSPHHIQEAHRWLVHVGLEDKASHYPHQLSGGQQRRVALARAFFNQPSLLLMDEPFTSLDAALARQLQELTLALWQKNNTTIVFVTHQLEEALLLGQRVILFGGNPTGIIHDQKTQHSKEIRQRYHEFYAHPTS